VTISEEQATTLRLNAKIAEQATQVQTLTASVAAKSNELDKERIENAKEINAMKVLLTDAENVCALRDFEIDQMVNERAQLTVQISDLAEQCREPTRLEMERNIKGALSLLPFHVRRLVSTKVTEEVKKRAGRLDSVSIDFIKAVAVLIKPILKLKSVAICIL